MQKRPRGRLAVERAPVALDPAFPFYPGRICPLGDAPIRSLHIHDCLEIGLCHEGSGIFMVEEKIMPFSAGDLIVIGDRETHRAKSAEGTVSRWRWTMLDPLRLTAPLPAGSVSPDARRLAGPGFRNVLPGAEHPDLVWLYRKMVQEAEERRPGHREAVRGLAIAFLAGLVRLAPDGGRDAVPEGRREELSRLAPALEHLAANYSKPFVARRLAALCHLSPTHFRRLFGVALGRPPHRYLTDLRMQMAGSLLRSTDRSVLQISLAVGYQSLSSFNRHFLRVMGVPPRRWRR